ncbi:calcium-dependent phosphotriesterase, partial [Coniochaeta ligniaria NRRL 30616]
SPFVIASPACRSILGTNPTLTVVVNQSLLLFHEGCIYHPPSDSLFAVSEYFNDPSVNNNVSGQYIIHVTNLSSSRPSYKILDGLPLANPISGTRYIHGGADKIVLAVTGNKQKNTGGIFFLDPFPPFEVTPLTTSYGDYQYDGPDDATTMPDGSIYFTDVIYGWLHGRRPQPVLPNMVYRYDPSTNTTRAMADLISRPNGVTRSPDGSVVYVGDTGVNIGDGTLDYTSQRAIYAHTARSTVSGKGNTAGPFLMDRRLFALPYVGVADGLKTDTHGNVWGLSTDGLHVWSPSGNFLGKILMDDDQQGGNFGFGKPGEVYIVGGNVLFKLEVANSVLGTGVYTEV